MIKRRFYRAEHNEKDGGSSSGSSSSSSSDTEVEPQNSDDEAATTNPETEHDSTLEPHINGDNIDEDDDNEEDNDVGHSPLRTQQPSSSSSSGYESEDSSANEVDAESAGLLANDDSGSEKDEDQIKESLFPRKEDDEIIETPTNDDPTADSLPICVLKSKAVYKCRLCPKIVCLNEESLKTHLKSKRHSRSEKLLNEGRLRRILNSDGEEEEISDDDGETHAERHARILAMAQDTSQKKSKGRQRQRMRLKRKKQISSSTLPNSGQQKENRAKRRKKNVD